jgi:hypothetical protein
MFGIPLAENMLTAMPHNTFDTLDSFDLGSGQRGQFYSLLRLEQAGIGAILQLAVSIRVLESILRNVDGKKITANERVKGRGLAGAREEVPSSDVSNDMLREEIT